MKNTRILSIVTMCIAMVLIITGYSLIFINEYRVDAKEKSSYASLIKTSFTSYTMDLEDISYDIKTTNIFNIKYYTEIRLNYSNNTAELNKIERKIKDVESTTESLLYECSIREYYDYDIDYKCDVISYNYESVINAYVSIVNKYNKRIEEYNNWLDLQNNLSNTKLAQHRSSYYTDFVDINEDGEYSGIIE